LQFTMYDFVKLELKHVKLSDENLKRHENPGN
jgi:hypothetical protein